MVAQKDIFRRTSIGAAALTITIVLAAMLLFGCNGLFPGSSNSTSTTSATTAKTASGTGDGKGGSSGTGTGTTGQGIGIIEQTTAQPGGQQQGSNGTGSGVILEVPDANETGGSGTQGSGYADSQADCATMSPTCGECISKANCGWCKSKNACYYGDSRGPAGDNTCPSSDWALTETQCSGPAGGSSCGMQTNCASCLSGSGCKWCIQGSVCTGSDDISSCVGGWLKNSFQCNYASR